MSYPGPVTRPKSVKVIGQACIGEIWRVHVCIWIFPVTSLVLSCLCANLKSEVEATALTSLRSTTTSQMTNYLGLDLLTHLRFKSNSDVSDCTLAVTMFLEFMSGLCAS